MTESRGVPLGKLMRMQQIRKFGVYHPSQLVQALKKSATLVLRNFKEEKEKEREEFGDEGDTDTPIDQNQEEGDAKRRKVETSPNVDDEDLDDATLKLRQQ